MVHQEKRNEGKVYFISEIKSRFLRKEKYEYYTKDFEYFSGIF